MVVVRPAVAEVPAGATTDDSVVLAIRWPDFSGISLPARVTSDDMVVFQYVRQQGQQRRIGAVANVVVAAAKVTKQ